MLLLQSLDCCILFGLNLLNLLLPLLLHILSQQSHLVLILELDLVGDALLLLADCRCLGDVVLHKSVLIIFLTSLLFLLLNF